MCRARWMSGVLATALLVVSPTARAETVRPYGEHLLVRVSPRDRAEVERIWRLAEHVLDPHDPQVAPHTVLVSRAALERLHGLRIAAEVRGVDVQSLVDQAELRRRARATDGRLAPLAAVQRGRLGIFSAWFARVQDLQAIEAHLDYLAAAANGLARVVVIGHSVEGRPIPALRLSSATAVDPARAAILVTGAQHAREWATPMVAMGVAHALVHQLAFDERVRRVLAHIDVYVVPVVNVDGYVASHEGRRFQRKNMNRRCGVDLNRNFDVEFGMGSASAGCNDENFPGAGPFSEPESQAVKALADDLPGLRLYLDYHAPAEQVMIPFAHTRARPPGYEKSRAWGELYAASLRDVHGTLHPARDGFDLAQGQGGGAIDWFRVNTVEAFAIELRDGRELGGFELPAEQIIPTVEENWVAWLALAQEVAQENPAATPGVFPARPPSPAPPNAPLGPSVDARPAGGGCAIAPTGGTAPLAAAMIAAALALVARPRRRR